MEEEKQEEKQEQLERIADRLLEKDDEMTRILRVNNETHGSNEEFEDYESFKQAILDNLTNEVSEVIIKTPAELPKNPSQGRVEMKNYFMESK
ncbi:TPA: hypothetical protein ACGBG5_003442 [Enterococcus faecalis]